MYKNILQVAKSARSTGSVSKVQILGQRICLGPVCPRVYHVGLVVCEADQCTIFEHGPIQSDPSRAIDLTTSIIVPLPSVKNTLQDVRTFEKTLPTKYIVGIRDCRHHVLDLLEYLYGVSI